VQNIRDEVGLFRTIPETVDIPHCSSRNIFAVL
jgi:hypothetical protein